MEFNLNRGMPGMPQLPTQLPTLLIGIGALFAGFGVFVLFNPAIVQWLVAGVFLVIGALLLLTGMRAKRMLGG